jgi:hypothetical protein
MALPPLVNDLVCNAKLHYKQAAELEWIAQHGSVNLSRLMFFLIHMEGLAYLAIPK